MLKHQLVILLLAILLLTALYQLPKVMVNNKNKTLDANTAQTNKGSKQENEPIVNADGHNDTINPAQEQKILQFKAKFWQEKDKQPIWADSLAEIFRKVNLWDSAAYYIAKVADNQPTMLSQSLKAGNAYYDAFGFAIKPEKAQKLAQKARDYFQKVLDKDPQNAEAKVKTGMTYTISNNPMQGILMIREVLAKEPNNTLALMSLGLLSMQSKQYDKATERFEKLLQVEPQNFEAKMYLAESYFNLNKKEKAVALLQEIKEKCNDANLKAASSDFLKQINP